MSETNHYVLEIGMLKLVCFDQANTVSFLRRGCVFYPELTEVGESNLVLLTLILYHMRLCVF